MTDGALPSALARHRPPYERAPRLALALITFSLIAVSLALTTVELSLEREARASFLIKNAFDPKARGALLGLVVGCVLLPALGGLVGWLVAARRERAERFEAGAARWAAILAPLGLVFWLPVLFEPRLARENALMYLVLAGAFVPALRTLLARAFDELGSVAAPRWLAPGARVQRWSAAATRAAPARRVALGVVGLAAGAFGAYAAYHAVQAHRLIQTTAFDLGIYDNLMFNALGGRPFRAPLALGDGSGSFLGVHAEYTMLVFLPLYALRPGPETLLVLQAVLVGLAAIPLYLAARHLTSVLGSAVVALAYLMFAPVHATTFSDFHWLSLSPFFLFWFFWALLANRTWLVLALLVVSLGIREEVALGLTAVGVFAIVTGRRVRLGWVVALVSAAWFAVHVFFVMPRLSPANAAALAPFTAGGSTLSGALGFALTNPFHFVSSALRQPKLTYALHFLVPLAFLPLARPALWLLLVPPVLLALLAGGHFPATPTWFYATALFVPYVMLGVLVALERFGSTSEGRHRRRAALVTLLIVLLGHSYCFGAVLQREGYQRTFLNALTEMTPEAAQRYERLQSLVAKIPSTASVAATDYVAPHVSARRDVLSFRHEIGSAEYVLVSARETHGENLRRLSTAVERQRHGLVARAGEFFLLRRGHVSPTSEAAFKELGIVPGIGRGR